MKQGDSFVLNIKDDGVGFEKYQNGNSDAYKNGNGTKHINGNGQNGFGGDGLKNMKVRANDIHAKLSIVTAPNRGTIIELEV